MDWRARGRIGRGGWKGKRCNDFLFYLFMSFLYSEYILYIRGDLHMIPGLHVSPLEVNIIPT